MPTNIIQLLSSHTPILERNKRGQLSLKEKGVKYSALVDPEKDTIGYQVDGDIINAGKRCDKLVLVSETNLEENANAYFIELKGKDVNHALEQIIITITNHFIKSIPLESIHARVVAKSYPTSSGRIEVERKKRDLVKLRCELKILKPNQIDSI